MFTGIITDTGVVKDITTDGDWRVHISTGYDTSSIDIGASIACDGCCLTVVNVAQGVFDVQVSMETLSKTNLDDWKTGTHINLERALRVGDELGGHIVSGHVDGVATVLSLRDKGDSTCVTFKAPRPLSRFIAPKGSVALNGTSLTVNGVDGDVFDVNLIPHTKAFTTWKYIGETARVNLEIDTLARYVARLAQADQH